MIAVRIALPAGAVVISRRQADVLAAAARGLGIKATAAALGIGAESVKTYREKAVKALGAKSITQACVMAAKAGVL